MSMKPEVKNTEQKQSRLIFILVSLIAFGFMMFVISLKHDKQDVVDEATSDLVIDKAYHNIPLK